MADGTLSLRAISPQADAVEKEAAIARIHQGLIARAQSLRAAIAYRELYFRVSLLGSCNLSCPFCHNEGAPTTGTADLGFVMKALRAALSVGFLRVQYTGGEPLLRRDIGTFVAHARKLYTDVGVTTNGVLIQERLPSLLDSGITRIHISLQAEELERWGTAQAWGTPQWLAPVLSLAADGRFRLRLNLPVPAEALDKAFRFLRALAPFGCDVKVFSILPEGSTSAQPYPLERLRFAVEEENQVRLAQGERGQILLREYREPSGFRCATCEDRHRCKESSHSLRLGADRILRPCLATRRWDTPLTEDNMEQQIQEAALLAIDYYW
jgi:cyclic pyranopterin phosphate synthase